MARTTGGGRRLAVSAVAISTLAGIAAFLYLYLPEDLTAALWIVTACSLALAGGVALQARALAGQAVQLSSDLDVVSERLLRLEAERPPPATTAPDPRLDDLSADVQEATAEIALLGEILRDLAVAVAAHDRELAALKAAGEKPVPVQREAPRPAPQVAAPALAPASLATRERPPPPIGPLPEWTAPPDDRPGDAAVISAFESDRLELHLQPVVSLPQRKVQFYEALARLRLDDGTLLVPAEFLPVLERRGLMPDLDRKVLARSAAIARHLAARGSEALIACNLASASLAEPGFLRAVSRLVEAHPDLTGRLVLELSQRCWRTLDAESAGALAQLRDRGLVFDSTGRPICASIRFRSPTAACASSSSRPRCFLPPRPRTGSTSSSTISPRCCRGPASSSSRNGSSARRTCPISSTSTCRSHKASCSRRRVRCGPRC